MLISDSWWVCGKSVLFKCTESERKMELTVLGRCLLGRNQTSLNKSVPLQKYTEQIRRRRSRLFPPWLLWNYSSILSKLLINILFLNLLCSKRLTNLMPSVVMEMIPYMLWRRSCWKQNTLMSPDCIFWSGLVTTWCTNSDNFFFGLNASTCSFSGR